MRSFVSRNDKRLQNTNCISQHWYFLRFAHITQASGVELAEEKNLYSLFFFFLYWVFAGWFHSGQLLHFQEKFLFSAKEIMHVLLFYYYYLLLSYQWKPGWWHLSWTFALHGEEKNNKHKSKSKNKNLNRIFFRHHNSNKKNSQHKHTTSVLTHPDVATGVVPSFGFGTLFHYFISFFSPRQHTNKFVPILKRPRPWTASQPVTPSSDQRPVASFKTTFDIWSSFARRRKIPGAARRELLAVSRWHLETKGTKTKFNFLVCGPMRDSVIAHTKEQENKKKYKEKEGNKNKKTSEVHFEWRQREPTTSALRRLLGFQLLRAHPPRRARPPLRAHPPLVIKQFADSVDLQVGQSAGRKTVWHTKKNQKRTNSCLGFEASEPSAGAQVAKRKDSRMTDAFVATSERLRENLNSKANSRRVYSAVTRKLDRLMKAAGCSSTRAMDRLQKSHHASGCCW